MSLADFGLMEAEPRGGDTSLASLSPPDLMGVMERPVKRGRPPMRFKLFLIFLVSMSELSLILINTLINVG